jgi:small-conductance mechanosensitive channel
MKADLLRRTLVAAALPVGCLVVPLDGRAQVVQPPAAAPVQQDTAAAESPPAAIPVQQIPFRADDAITRFRSLQTQIRVDPDISLIEDDLPHELAAISRSHSRVNHTVLEHMSLRELDVLAAIWRSHEERLVRWAETYEHEWLELQDASRAVVGLRSDWQLTLDELDQDPDTPRPLIDRTQSVVAASDDFDGQIRAKLESLLETEARLDDALGGVRQVLLELEDARASVRARIPVRNSPPIWNITRGDQPSASEVAARIWREDWQAVNAFVRDNAGTILFNVFLFLILSLLASRLHSRISSAIVAEDESLQGAADTLSRPISAALLVSILAANLAYQRTPVVVWQMLSLVAILPLYRLLPRSANPVINRSMRMLLALFAATGLGELLLPPSLEYRVFSLALGIAVVVTVGALLRGTDEEHMKASSWGLVVWRGLQLTLGVSAIAIVANVLGWTLLSEVLLTGLMWSAFGALALVIAYRVLAGVVRLLPYTRLGQSSYILRSHGELVTTRAIRLLKIAGLVGWTWLCLNNFELEQSASQWIDGLLSGSIEIGILDISLGKILTFLVALLLTVWIARFVRFVLDVEVLPRVQLERGASNAVSTVVQWVILGAGLLAAAGAAGLGASQLAIVFGALGVGIGFGLQGIVNNFVSGLILIFEQPVKVGDKVEITSLALTGEVKRIGLRASVVRGFDGAEVIVPNANLISSEVVNWTLSDQRRRIRTEIGVAYGTDPHLVMETLKRVAADNPEVLKYPEPQVLFMGFGASSLDFRLLAWTGTFDNFLRLRSDLSVATHDALRAAGITRRSPRRWTVPLPRIRRRRLTRRIDTRARDLSDGLLRLPCPPCYYAS